MSDVDLTQLKSELVGWAQQVSEKCGARAFISLVV